MVCRPRHFTRQELLVVVIIIAILSGMLIPVLGLSKEKMKRVNCAGNQKAFAMACLMYSGDYDRFFPNINIRGAGSPVFGNWQPLGSMQYAPDTDNRVWSCPSALVERSDTDCSNYRYIGSGLRDDNDSATLVTLGYDASGNHPKNAWMNALFIDGHVEGWKPDGSRQVIIIETLPDKSTRTSTSVWNRNDW